MSKDKKICKKCSTEKDIGEFVKQKSKSGKIKYANCKSCTSKYNKEYKLKNKERLSSINEKWRKKNKDHLKNWRKQNRESINKNWRDMYHKNNVSKIKNQLKSSTRRYVNKKEGKNTSHIIGCDYDQILVHLLLTLEKKDRFKYLKNKKDFHIDHIIPISWAEDEESAIELSNYKNLRLCAKEENWRKGNRWS